MLHKNLTVSGFIPQTSGIRSNRSANWATTTAHKSQSLPKTFHLVNFLDFQLVGNVTFWTLDLQSL